MAKKYIIPFNTNYGKECLVEIYIEGATGDVIELKGSGNPFVVEQDRTNSSTALKGIIDTYYKIEIISTADVTMSSFDHEQYGDVWFKYYEDEVLCHVGVISPFESGSPYEGDGYYAITLSGESGIKELKNKEFRNTNGAFLSGKMTVQTAIHLCMLQLFQPNAFQYESRVDISVFVDGTQVSTNEDFLSQYIDAETFKTGINTLMSCYEALETILAGNFDFVFDNKKWVIDYSRSYIQSERRITNYSASSFLSSNVVSVSPTPLDNSVILRNGSEGRFFSKKNIKINKEIKSVRNSITNGVFEAVGDDILGWTNENSFSSKTIGGYGTQDEPYYVKIDGSVYGTPSPPSSDTEWMESTPFTWNPFGKLPFADRNLVTTHDEDERLKISLDADFGTGIEGHRLQIKVKFQELNQIKTVPTQTGPFTAPTYTETTLWYTQEGWSTTEAFYVTGNNKVEEIEVPAPYVNRQQIFKYRALEVDRYYEEEPTEFEVRIRIYRGARKKIGESTSEEIGLGYSYFVKYYALGVAIWLAKDDNFIEGGKYEYLTVKKPDRESGDTITSAIYNDVYPFAYGSLFHTSSSTTPINGFRKRGGSEILDWITYLAADYLRQNDSRLYRLDVTMIGNFNSTQVFTYNGKILRVYDYEYNVKTNQHKFSLIEVKDSNSDIIQRTDEGDYKVVTTSKPLNIITDYNTDQNIYKEGNYTGLNKILKNLTKITGTNGKLNIGNSLVVEEYFYLVAAEGGTIRDVSEITGEDWTLIKPAENGTYATREWVNKFYWGTEGNTLTVEKKLGTLNDFDLPFIRNNVEIIKLLSTGLKLSVLANETTDVDKFLVSNNGLVKYRTGTQILSDIGALAAPIGLTTNYLTKWNGTTFVDSLIFGNGTSIGIGTNTPSNLLHLKDSGADILRIERTGVSASVLGISPKTNGSSGDLYFEATQASSGYLFRSRNSSNGIINALAIDRNGAVGIGTASPIGLFHLYGNAPILSITATNLVSGLRIDVLGQNAGSLIFRLQTNGSTVQAVSDSGNLGIGSNFDNSTLISMSKNIEGGTTTYGTRVTSSIQSTSSVRSSIYGSSPNIVSGFTLPILNHFHVEQATYSGSITEQNGFVVDASMISGTTNYAFKGSLASGTGRWNLYMGGTAQNYLRGNLGINIDVPLEAIHVSGSIRQSGVVSNLIKADANGKLIAAVKADLTTLLGITDAMPYSVGTTNYVTKWSNAIGGLVNSQIFDNGTNVGINTPSPTYRLDVTGTGHFTDIVTFDKVPTSAEDATVGNQLVRYSQLLATTSIKYLPTPVKTVSLSNITLSGEQTISTYSAVSGDRVLLIGQTDQKQNGIYVVGTGAWNRVTDSDTDIEIRGYIVNVNAGTYAGYKYINTNSSTITIGTTNITYSEFSNSTESDPVFNSWKDTVRTANYVYAAPNGSNGVASFRPLVSADIPNLSWAKITSGTPTTLSGYGITNAYTKTESDSNYVSLVGSYANPTWITSLPWTKITGVPTTLSGYGITDAWEYGGNTVASEMKIGTIDNFDLPIIRNNIEKIRIKANSVLINDIYFTNAGSSQNILIAPSDQSGATGTGNVTVGGSISTGQFNVVLGINALSGGHSYSENVAIGYMAGSLYVGSFYPGGQHSSSVYIGHRAMSLQLATTNEIVIGNRAEGNGDNTVTIGNSSIVSNYFNGSLKYGTILKPNNIAGTNKQVLSTSGTQDIWATLDLSYISSFNVVSPTNGQILKFDTTSGKWINGSETLYTHPTQTAISLASSDVEVFSTIEVNTLGHVTTFTKRTLPTASGTQIGVLSSTDWATFNNKQSALTFGNITGTDFVITGGTGAVIGGGVGLSLATITQGTGSVFGKFSLDTKGRVIGNTAVVKADLTTLLGTTQYLPYNTGTVNYLTKWSNTTGGLVNSQILDNGNYVGIGTPLPIYKLDVPNSTTRIGGMIIGNWPFTGGFQVIGNTSLDQTLVGNYALLISNAGATYLNATSTQSISFRINNTDGATLSSSMDFGIGTATPSERLHVVGSIRQSGVTSSLINLIPLFFY